MLKDVLLIECITWEIRYGGKGYLSIRSCKNIEHREEMRLVFIWETDRDIH